MTYHGDTLIVAVEGIGIELIDPLDPSSAFILPEPAKDLAVAGETLYVAAGGNGLLTVSLEAAPHILGRFAAGEANLTRIAASGARVYGVESEHIVHIYDVSNPVAVVEVATLDEAAQAIAASGTSLFTAGTRLDRFGLPVDNGVLLRVFDASQNGAPRPIAESAEAAGIVSGVALSSDGSIAYIVDRPYLRIFDISKSSSPKQIAALQLDNIQDHVRINADGTRVVLYNRGDAQLHRHHLVLDAVLDEEREPHEEDHETGAHDRVAAGEPRDDEVGLGGNLRCRGLGHGRRGTRLGFRGGRRGRHPRWLDRLRRRRHRGWVFHARHHEIAITHRSPLHARETRLERGDALVERMKRDVGCGGLLRGLAR